MAKRGAHIIDADEIGRHALQPGEPAWHSVVDQFGDEVLAAGSLDIDRKRLAAIVFNDPAKLAALNAIVHPVIFRKIADELEAVAPDGGIAVLDAALIIETGLRGVVEKLIVVLADKATREQRLTRERGFALTDVRARMAAQRADDELISEADYVVENSGSLDSLEREADRIWLELAARP